MGSDRILLIFSDSQVFPPGSRDVPRRQLAGQAVAHTEGHAHPTGRGHRDIVKSQETIPLRIIQKFNLMNIQLIMIIMGPPGTGVCQRLRPKTRLHSLRHLQADRGRQPFRLHAVRSQARCTGSRGAGRMLRPGRSHFRRRGSIRRRGQDHRAGNSTKPGENSRRRPRGLY
jgi:hypothetical protein